MKRRLLYIVIHKNGVKGNLLKSIQSVYSIVKSWVKTAKCCTESFACPTGLRQGCTSNPILVILVINEVPNKLQEHRIGGI